MSVPPRYRLHDVGHAAELPVYAGQQLPVRPSIRLSTALVAIIIIVLLLGRGRSRPAPRVSRRSQPDRQAADYGAGRDRVRSIDRLLGQRPGLAFVLGRRRRQTRGAGCALGSGFAQAHGRAAIDSTERSRTGARHRIISLLLFLLFLVDIAIGRPRAQRAPAVRAKTGPDAEAGTDGLNLIRFRLYGEMVLPSLWETGLFGAR